MDILEDRYLIVARKLSSLFGIWYTQTFKERVIQNCIVGFMFLYIILAQLSQLVTMDLNLRSIVSVLQMFIPAMCIASVYCASMLNFLTVQEILSRIVQDSKKLKDDIEQKIMQKYVNECKLFAVICGCVSYLYIFFYVFPLILHIITTSNEVVDVKRIDQTFDYIHRFFKVEHYYHPVVIYEILTILAVSTISIISHSLYFWFIQHACARLCIIKSKVHQLFENKQYEDIIFEKPLDLSYWTIDIIQRLSKTREFMALVNKLSEKCYLYNMSLGFLLVVLDFLCIPMLMQHKETRNDTIAFLIFIFDTIFPIYLNCFVGQRLMDYSNDVYQEMCLIPIHEISLKTQKLLLTTLMMNAKPCTISIGKMFVSSHEFFGELIRMAFSFAMMLHSTGHI